MIFKLNPNSLPLLIKRKLDIQDAKGQSLFKEGISCEVFKSGATGLQKGRLRAKLVLEFCPSEPESINEFPVGTQNEYLSNDEI